MKGAPAARDLAEGGRRERGEITETRCRERGGMVEYGAQNRLRAVKKMGQFFNLF